MLLKSRIKKSVVSLAYERDGWYNVVRYEHRLINQSINQSINRRFAILLVSPHLLSTLPASSNNETKKCFMSLANQWKHFHWYPNYWWQLWFSLEELWQKTQYLATTLPSTQRSHYHHNSVRCGRRQCIPPKGGKKKINCGERYAVYDEDQLKGS